MARWSRRSRCQTMTDATSRCTSRETSGPTWRSRSKSAIFLQHRFRSYNLAINFHVPKDRLISDPSFWYLIMCLDLARMGSRDPLFLVSSEDMHRHASPRLVGDTWHFGFHASMSPDSKDHWRPSQVAAKDLGNRVLQLLTEPRLRMAPSDATVQELSRLEHLVWVRRS